MLRVQVNGETREATPEEVADFEAQSAAYLAAKDNPDTIRAALIAAVYTKAQEKYQQAAGSYSHYEAAYWADYRREAEAYVAKGADATDADAPTLADIAALSGISTAEEVQIIIARKSAFAPVNKAILARRKVLLAALDAATTAEALRAIDIEAGWPV